MLMDLPRIGSWLDSRDVNWAEKAGHLKPIMERIERRLTMRMKPGKTLVYGKEGKCVMVHLEVKNKKHTVLIKRRTSVKNASVRSVGYYEYPLEGTTPEERRVQIAKCLMP